MTCLRGPSLLLLSMMLALGCGAARAQFGDGADSRDGASGRHATRHGGTREGYGALRARGGYGGAPGSGTAGAPGDGRVGAPGDGRVGAPGDGRVGAPGTGATTGDGWGNR
ncbi:hypothetical protein B7R77_05355 [Ralstonia solanacearum K60]|uniref:Uncharacterized protein n=1 Tax=Ralstonia solanacearum K60 TaxID=1091042 RepID=A0AAP8D5L0_RALSL|nr:hypothetical protein [Ralstonia solanacearum]OYQ15034.1 hypothetical protein B7R77_05355 [Ralstonia solanacearum K60]